MKRITNLIHVTNNSICKRSMSMLHEGNFKKAPATKATDVTNYHKGVTMTTCKKPSCASQNCADPNGSEKCPYTTPSQTPNLPVPNPDANFKTKVIGNLTSKVPSDKEGIVVDPSFNFQGKLKGQKMVVEPIPVDIDPKVTKYVQEPKYHQTIVDQINTK